MQKARILKAEAFMKTRSIGAVSRLGKENRRNRKAGMLKSLADDKARPWHEGEGSS